jgi:hypothetical protein
MRNFLLILFIHLSFLSKADEYYLNIGNNHSAFPFSRFSKLAYQNFHMSYEIGKRFELRENDKRTWSQTASIGYFNHKFVQSGIWIYGENEYHKFIKPHLSLNAGVGAGYYHMFTSTPITQQGANGQLEIKRDFGRPQALFGISLGITRSILKEVNSAPKIGLQYQIRMQTPFVKSYVPLLPYNALKLSLIFPIHNKDA